MIIEDNGRSIVSLIQTLERKVAKIMVYHMTRLDTNQIHHIVCDHS